MANFHIRIPGQEPHHNEQRTFCGQDVEKYKAQHLDQIENVDCEQCLTAYKEWDAARLREAQQHIFQAKP